MKRLLVRGGNALCGDLEIGGAKNAVLPIMAACLMVPDEVVLENVPDLSDVAVMCDLLASLGVAVEREGDVMRLDGSKACYGALDREKVRAMRASNLLWAPMVDRFGFGELALPGGCRIGQRPMDLHRKGLAALGVEVEERGGMIRGRGLRRQGAEICLDFPSVGATENIVMAAVRAEGRTMLRNAAREPEVADLCRFLCKCGAQIGGIGSDTLEILGVPSLHGAHYRIMADRVVCGTILPAVMACGGDVVMRGVCGDDLRAVLTKAASCGADIRCGDDFVAVKVSGRCRGADIVTMPYPGFPTDMQPMFMAALSVAEGTSVIREGIFENRFTQAAELRKMGADIRVEGNVAVVRGRRRLCGAEVAATDLRCGAALVVAALAAEGESVISGMEFVERGYEDVVGLFGALGGEVELV